jgi:8-oxo-dGTP pyrophosphatase MutT (NUDIX family)
VKINIGADVPLSLLEVEEAPVFKDWADRLPPDWDGEVTINAADIWGEPEEVHMLQMAVATQGSPWPVRITLRSETVDILVIVTDGTKRYVVFVEQEREATGGKVVSNAAGGREWSETVRRATERELWEELGLDNTNIQFEVELSGLIAGPVLASPGITNERVHMVKAVISVAPRDFGAFLEELHGKKTGVTAEGEELTLIVQPVDQARTFIADQQNPDAKTLLSLAFAVL